MGTSFQLRCCGNPVAPPVGRRARARDRRPWRCAGLEARATVWPVVRKGVDKSVRADGALRVGLAGALQVGAGGASEPPLAAGTEPGFHAKAAAVQRGIPASGFRTRGCQHGGALRTRGERPPVVAPEPNLSDSCGANNPKNVMQFTFYAGSTVAARHTLPSSAGLRCGSPGWSGAPRPAFEACRPGCCNPLIDLQFRFCPPAMGGSASKITTEESRSCTQFWSPAVSNTA